MPDKLVRKVQQPAVLLERGRREAFLRDLGQPFLCDGFECVCRRDARCRLFAPGLPGWIAPGGQPLPSFVSLGSGSRTANIGPRAKALGPLLCKKRTAQHTSALPSLMRTSYAISRMLQKL